MNNIHFWHNLPFFYTNGHYESVAKIIMADAGAGKSILPQKYSLFRAFDLTPYKDVKVIILGQDPYPNIQHACGLSFSVPDNTYPLPASLRNIFKELKNDLGIDRKNGNLQDWALQGVLLLNTALTVIEGYPGSHSKIGWDKLAEEVVSYTNKEKENLVYILWGKNAQKMSVLIDDKKHLVIKTAHPSPFSVRRGFFGSKPFSKTNDYLRQHNKTEINW